MPTCWWKKVATRKLTLPSEKEILWNLGSWRGSVREGNREGALKLLKDNPSLVNAHTAVARYLLGEQERGLAELDVLANETGASKTYNLRNDPTFDPMRKDSRFIAIVQKSGLYDN